MGKSVTVKSGFNSVRGPSPKGYKTYQAGQTIVYTDAEYAALGQADLRALNSPNTVADPDRPAVDTNSRPVVRNTAATGNVTLALGVNALTLTGNVTFAFPTGVAGGNESIVRIYAKQDATGSRVATWPAAAKAAGGTDPVLTTTANALDYMEYSSIDGGVTWNLINSRLNLS